MRIKKSSAKNFVILTFFSLLTVLFVLNEAAGASIKATEEWVATYDGTASQHDDPAKTVVDSSGNVYVTGTSADDFATVKYDKDGAEVWRARFSRSDASGDYPKAIAVDGDGNVYVAGNTSGTYYATDYVLVKYNSAGVEQWVQFYDAGGYDYVSGIALYVDGVSSQTFIHITGSSSSSYRPSTPADYATIKYDADGNELWVARFDAAGATDAAKALVVDGSGNVYVTGGASYTSPTTQARYATIKYNSDGEQQWVADYGGDGSSNHTAMAIGFDSGGNVIVSGTTVTIKYNTALEEQWATPFVASEVAYSLATDSLGSIYTTGVGSTVKFNSSGTIVWSDPFIGSAIAVDVDDDIYVAGSVIGDTSEDPNNYNFKIVKFGPDGTELWTMQHDGEGHMDLARSMALYLDGADSKTYVIVTGISESGINESGLPLNNYDTVKHAALDGAEQWSAKFDGIASSGSAAEDLAIDSAGNAYVTGYTDKVNSTYHYLTIKYDPAGAELWVKEHDFIAETADDNVAEAIAVDSAGNVYVTGTYENESYRDACGTLKYDTDGVLLWEARYDTGLYGDRCIDIGLYVDSDDGQTYAYVLGGNTNTNFDDKYTLIKYDSSGNEVWVQTYNYVADGYDDFPSAMTVDDNGNVYIAGMGESVQGHDVGTIVMFDKTGYEVGDQGYAFLVEDSKFNAVTVDDAGNMYLTGYSGFIVFINGVKNIRNDIATVKYDSEWNEVWAARYGGGTTYDEGTAIAVDGAGNVYVAGLDRSSLTGDPDFALIKYNASGVEQWVKSFDGGYHDGDLVTAIALDSAGTIYVTGQSGGGFNGSDYLTIAYDSTGNQLWFERFNGGQLNGSSEPTSMAVTDDGNVYVTGVVTGVSSTEDFGTVKYSQAPVTTDTVAPLITSVTPPDGTTGTAAYTNVIVVFNEAMNSAKVLDPSTFSVHDAVTGVNVQARSLSFDESTNTLEFDPQVYEWETTYIATVREGATDLAGNPLGSDYTWSFTTPPIPAPPIVLSVSPEDLATGVATTVTLSATFNEPMDPSIGFRLHDTATSSRVYPASVTYDAESMTAFFTLAAALEISTNYTATITRDSMDADGYWLGTDEVWSFTTSSVADTTAPLVTTTSPAGGATGVAIDISELAVFFNEPMKEESFWDSQLLSLTNTDTGAVTSYWVNSSGDKAYVTLSEPLALSTVYGVTLSGTVTDLSGNPLGEDHTWTFTTGSGTVPGGDDETPPQVVSATPDGTTLVPASVGLLTVTFNEPMDSATIVGVSDGSGSGAPFTVMVSGGAYITGSVTYDSGGMTARFVPDTDLSFDTLYLANMRGEVTDAAGNAMGADYSWSFTSSEDPGALGCDVDAGILDGCVNFDDFTYGTGVDVNTYTIGTTGPVGEAALRKEVIIGRIYSTDQHLTDNVESEASAYVDGTKMLLEARSRDINVTAERDGASAFAASKVDVTGAPPGTLIPMTVTITRSVLGDGYGVDLQLHDFDYRPLGTIIVRKGLKQLTQMIDIYGDPDDPANFVSPPLRGVDSATMTFELLYPAIPNNGIVVYFATGAKKTTSTSGVVESDATATIEFNPPPGVTVTMASGVAFTGELDSDGDGVGDSEDTEPYDATIATMGAATGSGQVEVAIDSSSGSGVTLSQVQSLDDSDISLNQAGKPGDYAFPDGIVKFNVNGLPIGGTAVVTITFPTAIPTGSKYYKVNADGFYEYLIGAEIATNTVTLTLVDGGQGDHDGIANGVIDDPGGIAVPQSCTAEIWYDGINQSCKTGSDYDQDGDGYDLEVDCDDMDAAINFGETEIWYDGINQSCKDGSDYDQDGDGYDSSAHGGNDCDDTDPLVIESCLFKNGFE